MTHLYTFLETTSQLQFAELYRALGIEETRFASVRQLNKAIAKQPPDILLAEFIYGFGNNYAGVNISNLDVTLYALQQKAPAARTIIVADPIEREHLPKLQAIFELDVILTLPVDAARMRDALRALDV